MRLNVVRWLGVAALMIGYPLLAHYTNQFAPGSALGLWIAIAPLLIVALVVAWRSRQRVLLLGVVAVLCLALWAQWSALTRYTGWVYWLEHAGTQLMLFMMFGRTLLAAQKPLCTRFAEIVHGANLTPQYRAYTRQVTLAWSVFFATIALMSSVLFFLTPLTTWSIFANFVTGPLVILMFVVEYAVRIRVRPEMRHHILDAVRAFRGDMAHPR